MSSSATRSDARCTPRATSSSPRRRRRPCATAWCRSSASARRSPSAKAGATEQIVARQLAAVTSLLGADIDRIVLAYEPVWAIGTGRTASPEQADAVHSFLRDRLAQASGSSSAVLILYGGSVKADNAAQLFARPHIDGGLIGGASLKAGDFAAICRAAAETSTHGVASP